MYDTIVNPVSSRQVKTTSKLGKKLLYNYEDKFDYVINPETNKIVQSGGKVGQQVLKKYKQKVASTNVGGRGGKKKTKRGGTGPDGSLENRSNERTYTCHLKSIGNYSVYETKASTGVSCNNTKCSYTDDSINFKERINNTNPNDYIMCRDKSNRKMNFNKNNKEKGWTQAMVGYENKNEELIDKYLIDDKSIIIEKWNKLKNKTKVEQPIDCRFVWENKVGENKVEENKVGANKCTTRFGYGYGKESFIDDVIIKQPGYVISKSPRNQFKDQLNKPGPLNTSFWLRIQSIVSEEYEPSVPGPPPAPAPTTTKAPPAEKNSVGLDGERVITAWNTFKTKIPQGSYIKSPLNCKYGTGPNRCKNGESEHLKTFIKGIGKNDDFLKEIGMDSTLPMSVTKEQKKKNSEFWEQINEIVAAQAVRTDAARKDAPRTASPAAPAAPAAPEAGTKAPAPRAPAPRAPRAPAPAPAPTAPGPAPTTTPPAAEAPPEPQQINELVTDIQNNNNAIIPTKTSSYTDYVKNIITISQNYDSDDSDDSDDSALSTIKDFKRKQLRKLVPTTIANDKEISTFINLLFKLFFINLKKYGIQITQITDKNDGIYLLLFNNLYVSVLRHIYNEWSNNEKNKQYKTKYQSFAMILYIIMNLYNVENFQNETQIEFELFYDKPINRLSEEVAYLKNINLYETINNRRPRINITSLKFDTHFKYISDYSIEDSLTIKLETIKKVFDILKTPYMYDVFDQYISTIDEANFNRFKQKIKRGLQESGLIDKTHSEIIHSTKYIDQINGCKRSMFTPKQIAKRKSLSPKCQSFLDVMMDKNEILMGLVKDEPKYYETLMNIYIDVIDSFSYTNFKYEIENKNSKKKSTVTRGTILLFKFIGLSVSAFIAGASFPITASFLAPVLLMIESTFNTSVDSIKDYQFINSL